MKETDLDHDGAMSFQEFERVMTLRAAPEFLQYVKESQSTAHSNHTNCLFVFFTGTSDSFYSLDTWMFK